MIEIRQATAKDAEDFYNGKKPMRSLRGFVAVLEGRVIGIAGVYFDGKTMVAFSDMKEEMRKYKKDIVRGTRVVLAMLEERGTAVFAVCKDERAMAFVRRCGFQEMGSALDGRLMVWNNPRNR